VVCFLLMGFKEGTRKWFGRVVDDKCQAEVYSEQYGFKECGEPVDHIHHIVPEGWTLEHTGGDPEQNMGLPLCKHHHVGEDAEEFSRDFSFHPDIGNAYSDYGEWKKQTEHMESITGKKQTKKDNPSPFDVAAQEHRDKTSRGERYWAGDENVDQHYKDKMRERVDIYTATHPEDKKPDTKPHPRHTKKKHWTDNV